MVTESLIAADIETGPLPDDVLLQLYDPPKEPFDLAVDIGRATKPEAIARKIAEAKVDHTAAFADWSGYCKKHKAQWLAITKKKAALDPLTGEILTISWGGSKEVTVIYGDPPDLCEVDSLVNWWQVCEEHRGSRIAFHNGFGFDLPFLIRRSWMLDVTVPDWVKWTGPGRARVSSVFTDTMTTWTMGEYNKFVKLDVLARVFGLEGKSKGCTGADFARMWYGTPEERRKALKYAKQDVHVTFRLAQLMGMG